MHHVSRDIDINDLKDLIAYDRVSGALTWRVRPDRFFLAPRDASAWNTRYSGKPALTSIHTTGHLRGTIFDKQYYAHRVAWAVCYGVWPNAEIDHINGRKDDNRIENLRIATTSQNSMNRGKMKRNTSGYKGVSWNKNRKMWEAQISAGRVKTALGMFKSPVDAHMAYVSAMVEKHKEFGRHE